MRALSAATAVVGRVRGETLPHFDGGPFDATTALDRDAAHFAAIKDGRLVRPEPEGRLPRRHRPSSMGPRSGPTPLDPLSLGGGPG